ncbi:Mucin-associated surface protein (MASP) [Trypanosoma cruzi]|uniref:Mucin-associated surface protein (MASP) n=1 Tax=Trypanosoma cruzi TaxID=5693 RepID=A0A2V2XIJ2_TRYCR|nr:Mucin-associated surface protein (MASP) [Trypanosoma cruzi]
MMTMTGRVLLVCALCVLWCGAGGGGRAEPTQVPPGTKSSEVSGSESDKNSKGAAGGGGRSDQSKVLKEKSSSVQDATGVAAENAIKTEAQVSSTANAEKKKEDKTQVFEDVGEKKGKDQEPKGEEEEEIEQGEGEGEEERREEDKDEEEQEEKRNGQKEEEVEKKEDAGAGTTEGMSAGGREQPSLSSGAEGASNITNPNSTPTTGDGDPAADAAGTREGKQNENKDANPKETPVTAAAMKTTTATTGDSDGSTAISHTASPLLLLLAVACAAAAAVVAA